LSRQRINGWPPRPVARTLPPWDRVPERDAVALVQHHASTIASLTSREWWLLREALILSMMEVMRDCADPRTRADAFDVLLKMGVFHL
jgi:hypothetical protein